MNTKTVVYLRKTSNVSGSLIVPLGRWKILRWESGLYFKFFPFEREGVYSSSNSSASRTNKNRICILLSISVFDKHEEVNSSLSYCVQIPYSSAEMISLSEQNSGSPWSRTEINNNKNTLFQDILNKHHTICCSVFSVSQVQCAIHPPPL